MTLGRDRDKVWSFKPAPFHQTPRWTRTAQLHKELAKPRCYHCGVTENLQSGHIVAQSVYKRIAYKLWNLRLECASCNSSRGNKLYWWEWSTITVLFRASIEECLLIIVNTVLMHPLLPMQQRVIDQDRDLGRK